METLANYDLVGSLIDLLVLDFQLDCFSMFCENIYNTLNVMVGIHNALLSVILKYASTIAPILLVVGGAKAEALVPCETGAT